MKKHIYTIALISIALLCSCGKSRPPISETISNKGVEVTVTVTYDPYKTLFVIQGKDTILKYHEDKIMNDDIFAYETDESVGLSNGMDLNKKYVQEYNYPLLVLQFYNIVENGKEEKRKNTYLFLDVEQKKVITKIIGKNLIRDTLGHAIGYVTQNSIWSCAEKPLSLTNVFVTIDGQTIMDINNNGKVDLVDYMRSQKLSRRERKFLNDSLSSLPGSIILPSDTAFSLPLSPALIDIMSKKYDINNENAIHLASIMDANNDAKLSWADDINLDGKLDSSDFVSYRIVYNYIKDRYGVQDSTNTLHTFKESEINIHDILFATGYYSQCKFTSFSPSTMGFSSTIQSSVSKKDSIYDIIETTSSGSTGGTLLGAGLGAFLGIIAWPTWPVLIASTLTGAGTGNVISQKKEVNYKRKTVEFYQYSESTDDYVAVAVFTTSLGYKVFFLDASPSMTAEIQTEIIIQYNQGRLTPINKKTTKAIKYNKATQSTSGRVSVYDPERNIAANYQNGTFIKMFQPGILVNEIETSKENVNVLLKPFENAQAEVFAKLWQLKNIAISLHSFQGEKNFKNQSILQEAMNI
jgi:hypothetical protein